jgi:hypothetical protein
MKQDINAIESLLEKGGEYGKTSYGLVKLHIVGNTAHLGSRLITQLVIKAFFLFSILFGNLGIALWIGDMLGKSFYGFFMLAAFYGLVALILHCLVQKWMKRILNDYLIRKMLN